MLLHWNHCEISKTFPKISHLERLEVGNQSLTAVCDSESFPTFPTCTGAWTQEKEKTGRSLCILTSPTIAECISKFKIIFAKKNGFKGYFWFFLELRLLDCKVNLGFGSFWTQSWIRTWLKETIGKQYGLKRGTLLPADGSGLTFIGRWYFSRVYPMKNTLLLLDLREMLVAVAWIPLSIPCVLKRPGRNFG